MTNYIKKYIPEKDWVLTNEGFSKKAQAVKESQFMLGNGMIGSRGILEEIAFDAHPGTYMAGVYDKIGSKVADLVNLPNPVHFKVSVKGEKLDVSIMKEAKHERHLSMKHGLLLRKTLYETVHGNKLDYQSIRFFSMHDLNLAVMRYYITPVNKACTISVDSNLITSVSNVSGISEGRKRHFKIKHVETSESNILSYMEIATLGSKLSVAYAHALHVQVGKKKWFSNEEHLELNIKKGQTAIFTKYYCIRNTNNTAKNDIKKKTVTGLSEYIAGGFNKHIKNHCQAWDKLWERSDVIIRSKSKLQKAFRFNIYHLLITGINDEGKSSIGAKTLSGEGYRGHIFWDSEIFILPFFIFTNPDIAKSLLKYRTNRMAEAMKIARQKGYKGAMFPWESAAIGEEETPTWSKNFDGSVIKIITNELEQHITADIAYSLYKYYQATGDEAFMLAAGYELLMQCARFWASRVKRNANTGKYEIRHVIGPDEFHEDIDNNAYTNLLARWNIFIAYSMYIKMKKKHPGFIQNLLRKMDMDEDEVKKWKKIIRNIHINITRDKIIEQFDGFFDLIQAEINEYDRNNMPVIPRKVRLKHIGRYKLIKQADVIMLMNILPDIFSKKMKKKNYNYYIPMTVHKSSLSPSAHAILASEIGKLSQAFKFYKICANTDLNDLHGNTKDGIHAANLGGTWQVMIHGFAGLNIIKGNLSICPNLPSEIEGLSFCIHWQGYWLRVKVKKNFVSLKAKTSRQSGHRTAGGIKIKVFNKLYNLKTGISLAVKR